MKTAVVIGATGATGKLVLEKLLASSEFDKIYTLTRKDIGLSHSKLISFKVDFENIKQFHFSEEGIEIDQLYFCYGTTLKKAGGIEAFKKIEEEYSKNILDFAKRLQIKRVLLISSLGADAKSKLLYNKTKGKIENYLLGLGFPEVVIFRPSLLLTKRDEFRFSEFLGQKLLSPFSGLFQSTFPQYAPVSTDRLSDQLIDWGKKIKLEKPVMIIENSSIIKN